MFLSFQKPLIEILKAVLKVCVAGIAIGLLKELPWILAGLIVIKIAHVCYQNLKPSLSQKNWVLIVGMGLTGALGIIAEFWGVSNGYWEYHEINTTLPAWLPFAWMMAFYILYKLEHRLVPYLKNPSFANRALLMVALTLVIPAFGEMVAIQMGVWSYYWPYQLLGVPVYAFIALVLIHMFIYLLLYLIFKNSYGTMLPFAASDSSNNH